MKKILVLALGMVAASAFSQSTLFNAIPGNNSWSGDGAANRDAEVFGLAQSNTQITGFDVDLLSGQGGTGTTVYNDIRLMVTFYGGWQSSFTDAGAEFNTPLSTTTFDLGGATLTNGDYYSLTGTPSAPFFTLPTPVSVPGSAVGAEFCWLADYGNGLGAANSLQLYKLIGSTPPSVGSNANPVYSNMEWTDSGATTSATSILQSSYRYGGSNYPYVDLAVTLYGNPVPEPASMAALGIGVLALIRRRRSRKA